MYFLGYKRLRKRKDISRRKTIFHKYCNSVDDDELDVEIGQGDECRAIKDNP